MKELYLIGGGGHAKSCIDVIESTNEYKISGIFDLKEKVGDKVLGYEIIGDDKTLEEFYHTDKNFLITLGQIKSSKLREHYFSLPLNFIAIISPRAYVSKYAQIGRGTIVMHDALVNAHAEVGDNCIINTKSLIEHDSIIGDHTHIATAAIINGNVNIGKSSFIGSNTVIKNNVTLSQESVIPYGVKYE